MSANKNWDEEQIRQAMRRHDETTANMRAELAQRSAGEVLYDAYLLDQLREGKSFAAALSEANAQYPGEALKPGPADLADLEIHYQFLLDMEKIDELRAGIVFCDQEIKKVDVKIAEELEKLANPPEQNSPADEAPH